MKVNKRLRGTDITEVERNLRLVSSFTLPVVANIAYLSFTMFCEKIEISYVFYSIALIYALAIMLYIFINTMCIYQMLMAVNPFLYPVFSLFMSNEWISLITAAIIILGIGKFLINKLKNK